MHADLILYNGVIHTLARPGHTVAALAVAGGRILATGEDGQVLTYRGPGTAMLDLGGRSVVPGLIDSHLHLLSFGESLTRLQLAAVRSAAELKALVRERTAELPPDEWILGRGWDQEVFAEKRYPSRYDLDEAAPGRAVVLRRACGHACVASTRALNLAGITRETPDPDGGVIDRDAAGEPTGVLRERAAGLLAEAMPAPGPAQTAAALERGVRAALAAGLTGLHTNDGFGDGFTSAWALYHEVLHGRDLPMRVWWDVPVAWLDEVLDSPYRSGSGSEWLKLGAVKLFADGSLGASTALLSEPYSDAPAQLGVAVQSREDLAEQVVRAHVGGMQVAIHAIGDRAIETGLDAIAKAQGLVPRPARHRIVHCQIMRPELFARFRELRVVADVQPKFVTTDMRWTEQRVGRVRMASSYAWRTFLESGVVMAGGSDCPVEPVEPLWGIYAAVTRQDMDGNPDGGWMPEQRLTVDQAVRLFTLGGAFAAFEEGVRGTLEPGKYADLVVLSADPYRVEPGRIKDLTVEVTIVGGRVAYQR